MTDTAHRGAFRPGEPTPGRPAARKANGSRPARARVARPVLRGRPLRRRDAWWSRPEVDPVSAVVLVGRRGDARVFPADRRPTVGDLMWAAGGALYEVDTGLHHDQVHVELPARGDEFHFYARVDIEWRVQDPERIVRDRLDNVLRALLPTLRRTMATVTRVRDIEQVEDAERAALKAISAPEIGGRYGLECSFWVRLWSDKATVDHAASKRKLDHELELEERGYRIREVKGSNERALLAKQVTAYRAYMEGGRLEQAALRLAKNPDDVAAVAELLRTERRDERQQAIDFISKLLESDAIDRWQVDETVRGALSWLQESVENVIRPSDQPIVPGDRPDEVPPAERPTEIDAAPEKPSGKRGEDRG